jgi:hypothetical protein
MYKFGTWEEEDMGIPRGGGSATLLPNGDAIITGGAQVGSEVQMCGADLSGASAATVD